MKEWQWVILWSILFWLTLRPCHAQTTLTGTITDAQRQPIAGALIEVQPLPGLTESAVAVADEAGRFTLRLPFTADSVLLSARALSFQEQTRRLRNQSQALTLALPTSTTQLKEVTVKSPPIRREGDTLSYRVSAFTDKKDRVIADVLKKLPGVEVEADGRILYEGRPIQKFYINGSDLLENRYSLASNNLPAEAVQDVQVLKRHQPVAALRGVQATEQASLNISLKNKVTATGQARVGGGLAPHTALWNVNLSPMLFTPKQQLIDTYQTNNTGQDVAVELKPLGLGDFQQLLEPGQRKPDLTGIQGLGQPPLAASRYLFNRAHLLSANHLVPFTKEAQLRVNASYLHDEQTRNGSTRTRFTLPDGQAITLLEDKATRLYLNQLTTDLAYIRNVKQYYLKNTLSLTGSWDSQTGLLQRPEATGQLVQRATNPFYTLSNRLGLVRPAGGQRMVQVTSVLTLAASPQQLTVSPGPLPEVLTAGVAYDAARQAARLGTFYTSNSMALLTGRARWLSTTTMGFSQEIERLSSYLSLLPREAVVADTLQNHLRAYQGRYYAQQTVAYKTDRTRLELELPLSYRTFSAQDAPLAAAQRQQFVTAEPQLLGRYELSGLWHATASAGRTSQFGDVQQLYYGYLLRDYRTLQRNAAPLTQRRTWRYSAGLYYENPLKAWLYHLTYSFSSAASNQLLRNVVRPDGSLTTVAVGQSVSSHTHALAGSMSKFVSDLKTNLSLQASTTFSRQPLLLNEALASVRNQTYSTRFRATTNAVDWGSLEYSLTLNTLRNQVSGAASPWQVLQEQHGALSLYPAERHQVLLSADYYRSSGTGATVRNVFADVAYRYQLPTVRKLELEVKWSNLFDARQYQYAYLSQFILVQNTYELRPSQLLASLRLSL